METLLKSAIGLEGTSGCLFDRHESYPGLSLGLTATKRVGSRLMAETGIEGGFFPASTRAFADKGPVGAFVGGGVFIPLSKTALMLTLRARSGYDFSLGDPYAGAGINAKIVWESPRSDGSASLFPFAGIGADYTWDGEHNGRVVVSAGFFFDLGN